MGLARPTVGATDGTAAGKPATPAADKPICGAGVINGIFDNSGMFPASGETCKTDGYSVMI